MRIGRSTGPTPMGGGAKAAATPGFAPAGAPAASAATVRGGAAGPVTGLDALLALQSQGGPLDRRRRAVSRAGRLLDGLDAVRLSLLSGGEPGAALESLGQAAAEAREAVDEPGLGEVLDAIETRAAVELAKRERRRSA